MTTKEIRAHKMWADVLKGKPEVFECETETRTISYHACVMEVLESRVEEITMLTVSNKPCDMYIKFEAMKLVMSKLIEAIEDFEV